MKPRIVPPEMRDMVEGLHHKEPHVRRAAVEALANLEPKRGLPFLLKALKDSDSTVRTMAISCLPQVAGAEALPHLLAALQDSNWPLRAAAVVGLPQAIGKKAQKHLVAALKDPATMVRQNAVSALGKIGPSVEPMVRRALQHYDQGVRLTALQVLKESGRPAAIPDLAVVLASKDKRLHRGAVNAIFAIVERYPRRQPRNITARGAYALAPHLLRHGSIIKEDHRLVRKVLVDFTEGRLHERSVRLYLKQLRAMKGNLK